MSVNLNPHAALPSYRHGDQVVDAVAGVAGIAFALTKNRLTADFNAAGLLSEIVTKAAAEG
jgi:hypothetical protein